MGGVTTSRLLRYSLRNFACIDWSRNGETRVQRLMKISFKEIDCALVIRLSTTKNHVLFTVPVLEG